MYGENKNEVPRSLLLDEYMQDYVNRYNDPSKNGVLMDRYKITNPAFWYEYMTHAIEMHMLNQ